jgi:hypothetical protein
MGVSLLRSSASAGLEYFGGLPDGLPVFAGSPQTLFKIGPSRNFNDPLTQIIIPIQGKIKAGGVFFSGLSYG